MKGPWTWFWQMIWPSVLPHWYIYSSLDHCEHPYGGKEVQADCDLMALALQQLMSSHKRYSKQYGGSHLPAVPQGKWLTALLPHRVISKDWLHPVCTQALYPTYPSGLLCHVVTDHADVQADSGRTMPAVNPRSAFVLKRRWYRYNKLSVLWFVVYFS